MESVLAAFLPLVVAIVVVRLSTKDPDTRWASLLFGGLTLIWLSPIWLTTGTPVSLDFLLDAPPLESAKPTGYIQKNFLLNDIPLQILPWREATVRSLRGLEFPFLDRSGSAGSPIWENPQTAVLYPPNLMAIPFSTFAWPMFHASAKFMIALVGMYLLLRELSRSHAGSVFGAVAWGFGAFTVSFLMFPLSSVTTLLPLLLFFFERRAKGQAMAAVWAAVTLFCMFTGGHPESVLHASLVVLPWCALRVFQRREGRSPLARDFLLSGAAALLMAAPIIFPFAGYLRHSLRLADIASSEGFLSTPPLEASSLIPFVIPNYFGNPFVQNYRHPYNFNELCSQFVGLTVLVFAFGIVMSKWRKYLPGTCLFVALFLLSTQPEWLHHVLLEVPILGITAHSRLRFAVAFLLIVAGSEGFDRFISDDGRRVYAVVAAVLAALVVSICLVSYPVFAQFGIRRLVFFTELAALLGCALVAAAWIHPAFARRKVLIGLLFLDLFTVVGLFNPSNGRNLYYPSVPSVEIMRSSSGHYRVVGLGRALQPNQAVFYGLEDVRPHDPLAFSPYVEVLVAGGLDRGTYFEQFNAMPASPLLDFLGVQYVIAPTTMPLPTAPAYVNGASVIRNERALSRYFVPREVVAASDPVSKMLQNDDRYRVFADETLRPAAAQVTVVAYEQNSTTLEVEAAGPSFVATSEVALPGWLLTKDGEHWPLKTINGPFLGWHVPSGTTRYHLRYEPLYLREGVVVGAIGVLVLLIWTYLIVGFNFRVASTRRSS
jgi:hypothetical protein